uniref:Uncharacterized protein n=1 Tax=Rhizophora mucronata TaxID=61149 RepID=A0A2P2P4K6_RHIMU
MQPIGPSPKTIITFAPKPCSVSSCSLRVSIKCSMKL